METTETGTTSIVDITLEEAEFPTVYIQQLRKSGVHTLGSVAVYNEAELQLLQGIGPHTVNVIKMLLSKFDLTLRPKYDSLIGTASRLYPDPRRIPTNVMLQSVKLGPTSRQQVMAKATLGDIARLDDEVLKQLLEESSFAYDLRTVEQQHHAIREFLAKLGL